MNTNGIFMQVNSYPFWATGPDRFGCCTSVRSLVELRCHSQCRPLCCTPPPSPTTPAARRRCASVGRIFPHPGGNDELRRRRPSRRRDRRLCNRLRNPCGRLIRKPRAVSRSCSSTPAANPWYGSESSKSCLHNYHRAMVIVDTIGSRLRLSNSACLHEIKVRTNFLLKCTRIEPDLIWSSNGEIISSFDSEFRSPVRLHLYRSKWTQTI